MAVAKAKGELIEAALDGADFRVFAAALRNSGFAAAINRGGPYTLFAPNDAAFAKFPQGSLDHLLMDDEAQFRAVVGLHFAAGKVLSARFSGKRIRAATYSGDSVVIDGKNGLRVNGARLTTPDIEAGACVIHGIDAVLWPREATRAAS